MFSSFKQAFLSCFFWFFFFFSFFFPRPLVFLFIPFSSFPPPLFLSRIYFIFGKRKIIDAIQREEKKGNGGREGEVTLLPKTGDEQALPR